MPVDRFAEVGEPPSEAADSAAAGLFSLVAEAAQLRATDSIGSAESAYARLDHALVETEKTRDDLARANAEVRAIQIAYAELLNLANQRIVRGLIDCIEKGGPHFSSGEDARWAMEMYLALPESQRTGARVSLPMKNRQNPWTLL